jgi:hypothetical protein
VFDVEELATRQLAARMRTAAIRRQPAREPARPGPAARERALGLDTLTGYDSFEPRVTARKWSGAFVVPIPKVTTL